MPLLARRNGRPDLSGRPYLFLLWGAGLIVLLGLSWPVASPVYNRLVATGTKPLAPQATTVSVDQPEARLILITAPSLTTRGLKVQGFTFQSGLLLVLALVLATPGMSLRRRLAYALAALVLFIPLHIILLSAIAWAFVGTVQSRLLSIGQFEPIFVGLHVLIPAMLGALWCWRYWLHQRRSPIPGSRRRR